MVAWMIVDGLIAGGWVMGGSGWCWGLGVREGARWAVALAGRCRLSSAVMSAVGSDTRQFVNMKLAAKKACSFRAASVNECGELTPRCNGKRQSRTKSPHPA